MSLAEIAVDVVTALVPTVLTLACEPTSPTVGQTAKFYGYLKDTSNGPVNVRTVWVYPDGAPGVAYGVITDGAGYYSYDHVYSTEGARTAHAIFDGDSVYEGCEKGVKSPKLNADDANLLMMEL